MNKRTSISTCVSLAITVNLAVCGLAHAYGKSGIGPSCKDPIVKILSPTGDSGPFPVAAGSEISFEVSTDAKNSQITMSTKDIDMPVQINKLSTGKFSVTGVLPASLTEGYANIEILAPSQVGKCRTKSKVLVKII